MNRQPTGSVVCELFKYVPCQTSSEFATPIASVPAACEAKTRELQGLVGAAEWCLVGPHVEPVPMVWPEPERELGDGVGIVRGPWCQDSSWLESEFTGLSCASWPSRVVEVRGLIERGEIDVDADCYAVNPADVIEACAQAFCP